MTEPDVVTIVFGHLPAERLCDLLSSSSVWTLESEENSEEILAAANNTDLEALPGQISSVGYKAGLGVEDWLRGTLDLVDGHHDGYLWTEWKRIEVIGIECTPAIERVAGDYGDVLASERDFSILATENGGRAAAGEGPLVGG